MKKLFKCLALVMFGVMDAFSQDIHNNDIVINEILLNPPKDGYDYVEGYNRSNRTIPLNELLIANRNATNDIAGARSVSKDTVTIEPGGYFIITANEKWVRQQYTVPATTVFCQVSSLPSFPDEDGWIIFLNKTDSSIVDELNYSEKWHFQLLRDRSGVALERLNPDMPTQNKETWTSASSSSGYGTPGYVNSQYRNNANDDAGISVLPKIFSPDNDGTDDFALLSIDTKQQGKIANTLIYDVSGRRVRYLVKNEILGANNVFKWDGCDDRMQRLPSGIYILFTQVFDLDGNTKKFRNCVVLSNLKK